MCLCWRLFLNFVPRYQITLASAVDEKLCRQVNLKFLDYRQINLSDYEGKPGTLIVERADGICIWLNNLLLFFHLKFWRIASLDKQMSEVQFEPSNAFFANRWFHLQF